ncbi:MAG: hypothetical protein NPIRA04_17700 [Nitrospirales bacterium]|nr:MAG: hypothetical protein NPIRA04_17700 [Nitrospirales bacterium]
MEFLDQQLDDIRKSLSPLQTDWMDEIAEKAITKLQDLPIKPNYTIEDIQSLLDDNFTEGLLCCRLFLGLSKDRMETELRSHLEGGGIGIKRYKQDPVAFLSVLSELGILEEMSTIINYKPVWYDILKERLRSGRGSAIEGQRRGRELEDFSEEVIKEVFQTNYELRCTFGGIQGRTAKCDFAIPNKNRPRILIESKGYGATGSKMSDIIGDLDAIVKAKRHDTTFIFVTDGTTWNSRISDLRKIVDRQNDGKIFRIYTTKMRGQFLEDLRTLKGEHGI